MRACQVYETSWARVRSSTGDRWVKLITRNSGLLRTDSNEITILICGLDFLG